MTMNRRTFISFASAACASALSAAPSRAQPAGAAPLTIVIPFAAGGASDLVVRLLADSLARELGRPVIAENKGGAGGLIAAALVGRAAPDGHSLLYGNQGQIVVARHLFPAAGPDPRSTLVPLTLTARTQFFLVVPADSRASSAPALAEAGRRNPLKVGIPGIGSPPHLATVLFGELTGAVIDVIPYQGSAPLLVDLIAGRLDAAFDNIASSMPHVRAGRLRALGASGASKAAVARGVPTLAEASIDGYAYQSWQGLFAPRGTPGELVTSLVATVHRTLADPAIVQRLSDAGLEVAVNSSTEFEALIAHDADEWDARVRNGLIRPA
jgi:tripartite-type tricarboxylate transporter receptor subunit TctC